MNIEQARRFAERVIERKTKWGKNYNPDPEETAEALIVLAQSTSGGVSKDELTRVSRQLTACTAREAGLRKQLAAASEKMKQLEGALQTQADAKMAALSTLRLPPRIVIEEAERPE